MTYFPIKTCPLCQQTLKLNYDTSSVHHVYVCPKMEMLSYSNRGIELNQYPISHYYVLHDGHSFAQHVILPPYYLITKDGKTMVQQFNSTDASFVMELPAITIEHPDKILKRIKMLIPFS